MLPLMAQMGPASLFRGSDKAAEEAGRADEFAGHFRRGRFVRGVEAGPETGVGPLRLAFEHAAHGLRREGFRRDGEHAPAVVREQRLIAAGTGGRLGAIRDGFARWQDRTRARLWR